MPSQAGGPFEPGHAVHAGHWITGLPVGRLAGVISEDADRYTAALPA